MKGECRHPFPFVCAHVFGLTVTAAQFIGLHAQRECYRASFRAFFRIWDMLLALVTITPAFPHIGQETAFSSRILPINGESVPYSRLQVYPGLASFSGQPTTAFPWGRTHRVVSHRLLPGGSHPHHLRRVAHARSAALCLCLSIKPPYAPLHTHPRHPAFLHIIAIRRPDCDRFVMKVAATSCFSEYTRFSALSHCAASPG